jgi:hypothetical protein
VSYQHPEPHPFAVEPMLHDWLCDEDATTSADRFLRLRTRWVALEGGRQRQLAEDALAAIMSGVPLASFKFEQLQQLPQ